MALESLESSVCECIVAGKLNFLFDEALSSVVGGASSSDDVKITSGVKIVRVGFVIAIVSVSVIKIDCPVRTEAATCKPIADEIDRLRLTFKRLSAQL